MFISCILSLCYITNIINNIDNITEIIMSLFLIFAILFGSVINYIYINIYWALSNFKKISLFSDKFFECGLTKEVKINKINGYLISEDGLYYLIKVDDDNICKHIKKDMVKGKNTHFLESTINY
ncbi:hypothetical protein [Clostridium intestinale]|uniref:Uncharacterized protein n=1 Tax=Clostridium intestinale DSM 6191 TaxID=1121320 RepID=A0A1M5U1F0_9CLOT|nr:hypothetical protein [Clostridium intestinale]SHH56852.1 hypothetical protein SAMN02745941_00380 [Clostridium intestinale DSM 6191]